MLQRSMRLLHQVTKSTPRLRLLSSHINNMAPTSKTYDLIVIGGGSGGSATARRASGWYGAKTLLIENGISGGCCVNVGCVPKKITWNMASMAEALRNSKSYTFQTPDNIPYDFAEFKRRRDANIQGLNRAYERNWNREGIELVRGTAKFTGAKELEVELEDGSGTQKFSAPHICIATGGFPIVPKDVPGAEHGITNEGFFALDTLPSKIAIVGAGYIAVEMAGMLHALGVEVHMFIRGQTFLRSFDPMVQETMTKHYEAIGVKIHKEFKGFQKVDLVSDGKGDEKILRLHSGEGTFEANELLWAIGRAPETGVTLEVPGVKTNERGYITVDEFQNTTAEGIYALGDVTGQLELTPGILASMTLTTPVAIAAGRHLGNRLFGPAHLSSSKLVYENVPTVVFAHPEIGTTGLTEPQAKEKYGASNIKIYHTKFSAMLYHIFPETNVQEMGGKPPTEFKIVCEGPEERIVGLHLIGDGVGEMLQGFAVAVKMGARKSDFDSCVAIHPTSAEEIVTMK